MLEVAQKYLQLKSGEYYKCFGKVDKVVGLTIESIGPKANVSSTRLILSTGNPGVVVNVFGQFVGGGNLVIGAIVFIVLIIIQFVVINKGSERVAEVTARFTLDAMPGKQMAIDADLNTGAITDKEAKARRDKIQKESSFYGAMDGATKYVKGDAAAGIIITLINLVGGTIMGVMFQGLDANEAIQKFGLLTIGDGLVSQIPSLLISLSTGILVTKGSNENDFSGELLGQLFGTAKVLYIVSIVLVVLGILTPLRNEWWLFIGLAVAFFVTGKNLDKKAGIESIEDETAQAESDAEEIRKPENVVSLLQVDPIELEFGYGIIPLADVNQGGDLLDRVVMIRRQIALELGTVVPIIRLRDNIQLNPNQYIIKIKGIQVTEGEILFDHYMAMNPGYVEEEITGIPTFEPSFHLPAIWITESQRERAESLGYETKRSLEKEANSKIMAINEYSDTVLDSINKAHNEIMFLYSMLNDKHDELTRLSGDIDKASSRLRSSFEPLSADSAKRAEKPSVAVQKPAEPKSGTMQQDTKPDMKQMTGIDISGIIKTQPASAAPASKAGATTATGTAAAVSVKASDAAFGTPAGSSANADVINHTHEILKLYKSGKSNVEIAKLLSLGTGEVKLIIDLYKEGK